jgi:hypothetical protein
MPDGQYFMMGDNRDESSDSRFWDVVSRERIKGRAFMVYWSYSERLTADATLAQRAAEIAGIVVHFLSSTRWDRPCFIVDSEHQHYAERTREISGE